MTEVSVTVYHNESRNRFWRYETGDELRQVLAFECDMPRQDGAANITGLLEHIWAHLQNDYNEIFPDKEREAWGVEYTRRRNRSLSMGDVVVLGETAWSPASVDWVRVQLPAAEALGAFDQDNHGASG